MPHLTAQLSERVNVCVRLSACVGARAHASAPGYLPVQPEQGDDAPGHLPAQLEQGDMPLG
eukprot:13068925-Alexandrium_andersonii.AAC.1